MLAKDRLVIISEQSLATHLNRTKDLTGSLASISKITSDGSGFDDGFIVGDLDDDDDDKSFLVSFLLFISLLGGDGDEENDR